MKGLAIATLTLLMLSRAALWGAEAAEEPSAEQQPRQDSAADDGSAQETQGTVNAPRGPSPDVFVPSDEISEDLSVSYPVDI